MDLMVIVNWLYAVEPILIAALVIWVLALIAFEGLSEIRLKKWGMAPSARSGLLILCGFLILLFSAFLPYTVAIAGAGALSCLVIRGNLGWKRKMDAIALPSALATALLLMIPQISDAKAWLGSAFFPAVILVVYWLAMDHYLVRKKQFPMGLVSCLSYLASLLGWYLESLMERLYALPVHPNTLAWISTAIMLLVLLGWLGYFYLRTKKKQHVDPLVLFDLDGTLIDSRPLVFETFRRVFAEKLPDYDLKDEELYTFFGPTLETTFLKYFGPDQVPEVIDLYQKINLELHEDLLKEMPHARDTLIALKGKGIKMGVVSNKRKEPVQLGLKLAGLSSYFSVVYGKEDLPAPKPSAQGLIKAAQALNVPAEQVVYVGDNKGDIEAAKNMGAYSVGYTIDEKQRAALEEAECCILIDDLMQLDQILQEDKEWIDKSIW